MQTAQPKTACLGIMTLSAKIAMMNKAKTKYLYFGLAKNLLFKNIAGIKSTKIKNGITVTVTFIWY